MPKHVKTLTDAKCRNARTKEQQLKMADGQGLFLLVKPDGTKFWRYDYMRPSGKRNSLSFGKYPEVTLQEARDKRSEARAQLAKSIDPADVRRTTQAETFEPIALEWIDTKSSWSERHKETTLSRLRLNIFPWLGVRPIKEIAAPELLAVLRRIEAKGNIETAHRCRSICGQVFRYAIATGRCDRDVAADLKGALKEVVVNCHAAIIETKELAALLRAMEDYSGHYVVCAALRFAPLVFLRPGELRHARWQEFDLETATWAIPIERMKLKKTEKIRRAGQKHVVPLSRQALEIIQELQPLTGQGDLVFPSVRIAPDAKGKSAKPLSENTIGAALNSLGYKGLMTAHGWRATAKSHLEEVLGHNKSAVERQLAHAVSDPNGESYDRAQYFDERREMMQRWADYLDMLKAGGKVIPLRRNAGGE